MTHLRLVPALEPPQLPVEGLVLRAGAHATVPEFLKPQAQTQGGVSDLDIARLLFFVERGGLVWPTETRRAWKGLVPRLGSRPSLTRITQEALRLGLARVITIRIGQGLYRTKLAAAPVHLDRAEGPGPACHRTDALRWRLLGVEHLAYVDCVECFVSCASGAS
jgi:hypothetical protein